MNQNYREEDKISELRKDLGRLQKSLDRVKRRLEDYDNDPDCDPTEVTKFIYEKDQIVKMIDEKTRDLRAEEHKQQTSPGDEEQRRLKSNFDKKNNSYSGIRSSYMK
jgi:hypothetical protein